MLSLLAAPQLWIGLALMLGAWFLLPAGRSKQVEARIARAARRREGQAPSDAAASLRRRDPGTDTPLGQLLGGMSSISKLKARFEVAGIETTPQKFLAKAALIGVVTCALVVVLGKSLLVGGLAGLLVGLGIPHLGVSRRIRKRQKRFLAYFPDAIDLMVRGLRAGLPVAESFITVSQEVPDPVGTVFGHVSQQTALGVPMEKALAEMAAKLQITEFNFFVTSLILQRETGGNLGEILHNLAEMLRARHMMKLKIGALSSEARASAYIVGALPIVVMLLLQLASPEYLVPLFTDYRGNLSLAAAGGSMALGAGIMRKMTQLEI